MAGRGTVEQGLPPLVSVIIPTWNRRADLLECLRSVVAQQGVSLEILVLDDGSTDGTEEAVRDRFPGVAWLADGRRTGHVHRRNQGILRSRGTYLLFLDSDSEFPVPTAIATMVRHFEDDPTLGELGGEIAVFAGEVDNAHGKGLTRSGYSYRIPVHRGDARLRPCAYLAGCNLMVRREVAIRVGGFDPYYVFGHEDTDFGDAVAAVGLRNCVVFGGAVLHKASSGGRHADETYRYCRARVRFLLKRRGLLRTLLQFTWDMAVYGLRCTRESLGGGKGSRLSPGTGRMLWAAYRDTLCQAQEILRARSTNFLAEDAVRTFETWVDIHMRKTG